MNRVVLVFILGLAIGLSGCAKHEKRNVSPYTKTVLLGTWFWDVESNKQGQQSDTVDFWWEHVSHAERCLVPMNGALAKVVPGGKFDKITPAFIKGQDLSSGRISGSDKDGLLTTGTVVVFRTAEGNLGKLQVERYWAKHDFSFPEAKYLSRDWKRFVLQRPNTEMYHLQVRWQLFK